MKILIHIFIAILLLLPLKTFAITADVTAEIVSTIEVEQNTALSFGSISSGTIGGEVEQRESTISSSSDIEIVSSGQQGRFTVSGKNNNDYNIIIDNITKLTGGTTPMNVTLAINDGDFGSLSTIGTLNSGIDIFTVNGKLTIPPNQDIGSYSGTYRVTVSY